MKPSHQARTALHFCSAECRRVAWDTRDVQEAYWSKVAKSDDCWIWLAAKDRNGYGFFRLDNKQQKAHRVAWKLATGEDPGELFVLHTCDNPSCVRNDEIGTYEVSGETFPRRGHLFLATTAVNSADMVNKGRTKKGDESWPRLRPERLARGETAGLAKLTDEAVREIRRLYAAGGTTHAALAKKFGVTEAAARFVIIRKTWKHVE